MSAERLIDRPFLLLVGAHLLQALGFASMLLLPLYLDFLGASRAEIGAAMATASIGGLAGRPLVGWGLDVVGRKPVLVAGTLVLVAGMALVATVTSMGPGVYIMRLLVGLGAGTLFAAYFTLASDRIPASRRTEGLALFGISGLVPLLVNPFADQIGIEPSELRWFLPAVGGVVLCSLLFLPGVPDPPSSRTPGAVSARSVVAALGRRQLMPVWLATVVLAGLVSVFMAFATVAAEARGIERPSTLWLTYALGAVSVRLVGAKLPDRIGPIKVGAASLGTYSLGFWFASSASTGGEFAAAALCAGIGHGYAFPVLAGQVVTRSPAALRGMSMAAFTGLWELARLVLAPGFGLLADRTSDGTMLRTASLFGLAGIVAWLGLEALLGRAEARS